MKNHRYLHTSCQSLMVACRTLTRALVSFSPVAAILNQYVPIIPNLRGGGGGGRRKGGGFISLKWCVKLKIIEVLFLKTEAQKMTLKISLKTVVGIDLVIPCGHSRKESTIYGYRVPGARKYRPRVNFYRDLTKFGRERRRERHKTIDLITKYNDFTLECNHLTAFPSFSFVNRTWKAHFCGFQRT